MGPYIFLLVIAVWMALINNRPQSVVVEKIRPGFAWLFFYVFIVLMIGFRQEVGGDWWAYLEDVEYMRGEPVETIIGGDPAFELLNWIGANIGGGVYFTNLISAAIFSWGLFAFCRTQPRPWLALLIAIPYLVTVVSMVYPRQSVAIGLAMLAIVHLTNGRSAYFFSIVFIAALFHKSAIILTLLVIFIDTQRLWIKIIALALFALCLLVLQLLGTYDYLYSNYVVTQYEATGASIRIIMNVIPALLFLAFEKRFLLTKSMDIFWKWMSWLVLLFIPLLIFFPSSNVIDRLALYMIPLQLVVISRIPDAFGVSGHSKFLWIFLIMIYSASIMFGWLLFSDTASYSLPYRFYPWEALWE